MVNTGSCTIHYSCVYVMVNCKMCAKHAYADDGAAGNFITLFSSDFMSLSIFLSLSLSSSVAYSLTPVGGRFVPFVLVTRWPGITCLRKRREWYAFRINLKKMVHGDIHPVSIHTSETITVRHC